MTVYSRSSIQNINNRRFWNWKNTVLSLINKQPDIDEIYLYAKDPYDAKYQFLINKRESAGLKHFNDTQAFIEHSDDMQDVYENIQEYNIDKIVKY